MLGVYEELFYNSEILNAYTLYVAYHKRGVSFHVSLTEPSPEQQ